MSHRALTGPPVPVHPTFSPLPYGCLVKKYMDDTDSLPAAPAADWTHLHSGKPVTVSEDGHPVFTGTIDGVTSDASILWVRLNGLAPRRMFLHTDPVDIRPAH